jgi:hypothetical protein
MTIPGLDAEASARELGAGGVDNIVTNAERVCSYESERIALTNESVIVGLRAQFNLLRDQERHLEARLQLAPPAGDLRRLRLRALYYWCLTALLIAAGFVFALLSFEPFRLGWKSWLYCAGIAALTPFLVEKLLDGPRMERVVKALTAAAAVAALVGLMLLAVIRGNLLGQQIRANDAPVVILDDAPQAPAPQNDFYESTLTLLRVTLLLFAFAMELGAGLALHEAWRTMPDTSEDGNKLRAELATVRFGMAHIARQATTLKNEPAIFAARFWRDFYRGLLTKAARNAMSKLRLSIWIVLLLPLFARAQADNGLNVVIAIDLSRSVAVAGPDDTDEFRKNVDGVARILGEIPAGARITVIGITDHSFTEPYILLRAQVPHDPGYFGERLQAAHRQLVVAWKARSTNLAPRFPGTDILGALALASQLFAVQASASRGALIVFSDMRQNAPELDLESPQIVPTFQKLAECCKPLPDLHGIQIYVLGADGAGKSIAYFHGLQGFWREFFSQAGAVLREYSALGEVPQDSTLTSGGKTQYGISPRREK